MKLKVNITTMLRKKIDEYKNLQFPKNSLLKKTPFIVNECPVLILITT